MADACAMFHCIEHIEGKARNSMSDTDTWIVTLSDNTTFNGQPVTKAFVKIGINPSSILYTDDVAPPPEILKQMYDRKIKATGLMYEFQVYDKVIGPILANHVCPNFLRPYLVSYNCRFQDLQRAMSFGLRDINPDTRLELLLRNVDYMSNGKKERPAIHDQTNLNPKDIPDENRAWRFMVLTTEFENVISYWDFLNPEQRVIPIDRMAVLLQILVALYVMEKSKLVHHDLHAGNVLVQRLAKPTTFTYILNGEVFSVETEFKAMVYDFDWATCESLGPNARMGERVTPFKRNLDLVRLYKSMTPKEQMADKTLDRQHRSLMHKVVDLTHVDYSIAAHRSSGKEIPDSLLGAIQAAASYFQHVKPSDEPYVINDDRFASNGTLNLDYKILSNIRWNSSQYEDMIIEYRNSLQKCERESVELRRRVTDLEAQLSYVRSLMRKHRNPPYARR
jgi:hypothetical protein